MATQDFYIKLLFLIKFTLKELQSNLISVTKFLPKYYLRNELIWVDGFLFDFLQKKSADLWIRKFVIYTGFLFSERLVFDYVVKIYLDNIIWPLHYSSIFESNNVLEILTINIFFYFFLFSVFILFFFIFF